MNESGFGRAATIEEARQRVERLLKQPLNHSESLEGNVTAAVAPLFVFELLEFAQLALAGMDLLGVPTEKLGDVLGRAVGLLGDITNRVARLEAEIKNLTQMIRQLDVKVRGYVDEGHLKDALYEARAYAGNLRPLLADEKTARAAADAINRNADELAAKISAAIGFSRDPQTNVAGISALTKIAPLHAIWVHAYTTWARIIDIAPGANVWDHPTNQDHVDVWRETFAAIEEIEPRLKGILRQHTDWNVSTTYRLINDRFLDSGIDFQPAYPGNDPQFGGLFAMGFLQAPKPVGPKSTYISSNSFPSPAPAPVPSPRWVWAAPDEHLPPLPKPPGGPTFPQPRPIPWPDETLVVAAKVEYQRQRAEAEAVNGQLLSYEGWRKARFALEWHLATKPIEWRTSAPVPFRLRVANTSQDVYYIEVRISLVSDCSRFSLYREGTIGPEEEHSWPLVGSWACIRSTRIPDKWGAWTTYKAQSQSDLRVTLP